MTTCVPIKLGGVSTHRLIMHIMCWQPGKTGVFLKKMFANFNKYACDFVSVDDFSYVNTDDVEKAMDVATVEVDKVDSQGGICY